MTWMFLTLTLSSLSFAIYLILEYKKETGVLYTQLAGVETSRETIQEQIRTSEAESVTIRSRITEIEHTVRELQTLSNEIQDRIAYRKNEMERQGRYRIEV